MSFHRRRSALAMYEAHAGPNMTPMVDVVMVILIFFMASAAILGPEWFLKTSLPRTTATAPADESLLVRVRVELVMESGLPRARIDGGEPVSVARVEEALQRSLARSADALRNAGRDIGDGVRARAEIAANVAVLVNARDDVAYEEVVRVHEMARALGIEKIGIVE
jgi:biopolymer transport protein ExbD